MSIFNKHVGKHIDKAKTDKLIGNWKKSGIKTQSSFVGSDIINQLLQTDKAVGLRIYYGLDDEGNMQPVFYAADENGKIIRSSAEGKDAATEPAGVDTTIPCPPYC